MKKITYENLISRKNNFKSIEHPTVVVRMPEYEIENFTWDVIKNQDNAIAIKFNEKDVKAFEKYINQTEKYDDEIDCACNIFVCANIIRSILENEDRNYLGIMNSDFLKVLFASLYPSDIKKLDHFEGVYFWNDVEDIMLNTLESCLETLGTESSLHIFVDTISDKKLQQNINTLCDSTAYSQGPEIKIVMYTDKNCLSTYEGYNNILDPEKVNVTYIKK